MPLGFLIPSVLFGRISNDWPAVNSPEFSFMLSVSVVAVLYRFLVAIAAPVWLTRSASEKRQRRAALISILILLATQVGANIYWLVQYNWLMENLYGIAYLAANQLIYGIGMALALTLNRPNAVRLEEEEERARRVEREILRGT